MPQFILARFGYACVSLALLALTIFFLSRLGGDPVLMMLEPGASQSDIDAFRLKLGLDRPILVQFWQFVSAALQGDFGRSIYYQAPVLDLYLERLPSSLLLAGAAFSWSVAVGVVCGVFAALHMNRWWDHLVRVIALVGLSMPAFWMGMLLILFLSVYLKWLPSSGSGSVTHMIMPTITLGWYFAASHMRLTRSAMIEVLGTDYVKLARLKGLPEWQVVVRHALKGALIPVLTLAALNLVSMVNAAVVVETVFAWPGLGRLLFEAISFRDFPVIQAVVLLAGAMIIAVNLLVDILYAVIDPRIRYD